MSLCVAYPDSKTSCVLTAVIGMLTVMWYSIIGGQITEEEAEHEVREAIDKKAKRGKFFGLIKPSSSS